MKKIIALVIVSFFTVMVFAQKKPKIKGNKSVKEVQKEITEDFNTIEIDDALKVKITQAEKNEFFLRTDENLIDIIQFNVKNDVLKIYTTNKIISNKKLEIDLNIKELKHIILKNDASLFGNEKIVSDKIYVNSYNSSNFELDISAEDVIVTLHRDAGGKIKIRSKNTTIVMNDNTDLKANVSANKIVATLNKSAQLSLNGNSDYASFNLKDSSELDAKKIKVSSVDLYTSNTSDVYVFASKNLELYAQGKSNIYVYGSPKMEIKGLTDKSKIIKK